jgi:hypothetical protein
MRYRGQLRFTMGTCNFQAPIKQKPMTDHHVVFKNYLRRLDHQTSHKCLQSVQKGVPHKQAIVTFLCMPFFFSCLVPQTRPLNRYARSVVRTTRFGARKCLEMREVSTYQKWTVGVGQSIEKIIIFSYRGASELVKSIFHELLKKNKSFCCFVSVLFHEV